MIVVAAVIWLLFALKEIVVLVVVGYTIAYVMDPALRALDRRGISRPIGVFVLATLLAGLIALLAVTAIPTVVEESQRLSANLGQYMDISSGRVGELVEWAKTKIPSRFLEQDRATSFLELAPRLSEYVSGPAIAKLLQGVLGTLLKGYSLTLTIVNILLLPFIVFYLAVDLPKIHRGVLALVPVTRRARVARLFGEIDHYTSSFVRGQLIVCSILFVLYAVGLGAVGVELWLLLAVISGFGNLIPYLGFVCGIVLSSVMSLATFGDWSHLLMVWGVFALVQFLEGTFITPRVVGESVGLSPLVVILALFAGGQLFGLLGIFLAVPVAAALRVLAQHAHEWVLRRA
jgi:predicted PurR-regulated permease PerM